MESHLRTFPTEVDRDGRIHNRTGNNTRRNVVVRTGRSFEKAWGVACDLRLFMIHMRRSLQRRSCGQWGSRESASSKPDGAESDKRRSGGARCESCTTDSPGD